MTLRDELSEIIDQMKAHGVEFDPGLSDTEISEIEKLCKFQFPPDLRQFLQMGVPLSWTRRSGTFLGIPVKWRKNIVSVDNHFPNWRNNPIEIMDNAQKWTFEAFTFDVEHANFWMQEWGERPQKLSEAFAVVERYLETVPLLIPIVAHRFLPAEPNLAGNPVFSVWQAIDTIYYGYNLQNYLKRELQLQADDWAQPSDYRPIRFWSKIVS